MARSPASRAAGLGRLIEQSPAADSCATDELTEMRAQLLEAQETIEAIRRGEIDSLVIGPSGREQLHGLAAADRPYRLIFEAMNEGAASISPEGVILEANPRLCEIAGRPASDLAGSAVAGLTTAAGRPAFERLLDVAAGRGARGEAELAGPGGTSVPVLLAVAGFDLEGMLVRCLVVTDLTGQRAAESRLEQAREALREQNAFVEQAQASAGLGWWVAETKAGGRFTGSPQTFEITGLSPEDFDGTTQPFSSVVHPDDAQKLSAAATAALNGDSPFQVEHRVIRPDGALRWVQQSAVVERDAAGAATRMLGICQDITDRKKAEDEIRTAGIYNRSLIDASLDPMVTIGADGKITDANTATEQATGRLRAELVGTEFSGYFTDPDLARAGYEQVFRDGTVHDFPLQIRHRDGQTTPVLYNASVYRNASGQIAGVFAVARDVTQARATESALRDSEERLHAIFDNAPVGIDELALGGEIVRVNPRFCEITGYNAAELQSRQINDLIHPDDVDEDRASLQRLLSGEISAYSIERRYLRKEGGVVWAEVNRAIVRDRNGEPLLIVGAVRDITAQHRAEADVHAADAYNRSLIEASLDPLVTIGQDGKITDVNTATVQATGYERAELIGTEFSRYFTDPGLARAGYERAFRQGTVRDYPLELRCLDGHAMPVRYNASVYRDASGHVLGVFAAARDVTEMRRAETALRESQERLSVLVDKTPIGITEMTPDGQITRVNARVCQLTGYAADELLSMRTGDISDQAEQAADAANMRRLLAGEIQDYVVESSFRRKTGETVLAELSRAMVRDDQEEPLLVVTAVRDISAQRRAEAKVGALNAELGTRVEERTAELQRANKSLEAFTYSVSHDLRAPLRALSGFSEALVDEYGGILDETGRGYAGRIRAASEKMATLIDDLLHLSRVSRAEMNVQSVDLSVEVAAIAEELRVREPGRHVAFAIEDGVLVRADRALIRSVVQNLFENSWKFTSHRDSASIEFGTAAAGNAGLCCYVRDDGAGFDPAYASKLFQPFQRLHAATDFPGTGIGLASVQRIIERHGGRIWAEGAVDHGATFYFTLGMAGDIGKD